MYLRNDVERTPTTITFEEKGGMVHTSFVGYSQGTRDRGTVGIVGCAEVLMVTGPWSGYRVNMVNKVINKVNARLN